MTNTQIGKSFTLLGSLLVEKITSSWCVSCDLEYLMILISYDLLMNISVRNGLTGWEHASTSFPCPPLPFPDSASTV